MKVPPGQARLPPLPPPAEHSSACGTLETPREDLPPFPALASTLFPIPYLDCDLGWPWVTFSKETEFVFRDPMPLLASSSPLMCGLPPITAFLPPVPRHAHMCAHTPSPPYTHTLNVSPGNAGIPYSYQANVTLPMCFLQMKSFSLCPGKLYKIKNFKSNPTWVYQEGF